MRASSTSAFRLAGAVLLLGPAVLGLSGCLAIPPGIAIASYVIDAGSFVATGKTATDHAVSAVAQQDCALLRGLSGPICVDEPDYQLASAGVLEPLPPDGQLDPPLAITPLVDGDMASLPLLAGLPDASQRLSSGELAVAPVARETVLSGASYLAEGLIYPTQGNNGG
jgi:hypothetical protein